MIYDSFWGVHISFCCEGDILESDTKSDTILMTQQEIPDLENTLNDVMCNF